MEDIDAVCGKYHRYATLALGSSRMITPWGNTPDTYLLHLRETMDRVEERPYFENHHDYSLAYFMLMVEGPFQERIDPEFLTPHFRSFAKRCISQGVNPDLEGMMDWIIPVMERIDRVRKNGLSRRAKPHRPWC